MEATQPEEFAQLVDEYQEEFETPDECHRMAAYHLTQAAKHHEIAAEAYANDDQVSCDLHAYRAYKHQLNGQQYAEMAAMDVSDIDDIEVSTAE